MSSTTFSPLAVIGLGCRLPGAESPADFWNQAMEGARRLSAAPAQWQAELGLPHPLRGGFTQESSTDWQLFRLPPQQVARLHRHEKLMHLALMQAAQDAGYSPERSPGERCAVYLGANSQGVDLQIDHAIRLRAPELREHLAAALQAHPEVERLVEAIDRHVAEHTPPITHESFCTSTCIASGRFPRVMDVRGGHLTTDAGVASGLAALKFAAQSLLQGHCDVAVVGGVAQLLSPSTFGLLAARDWLAERELLSLDSRSAGTLPGEGAVAVVLKRLEDALAEGQRIYAVLHGVASEVNPKQGLARISRLVERAARTCLEQGGVEPEAVRHVEVQACGVATLEDAEYVGIKAALAPTRKEMLTLASGVPQVGFQQAASGLVSLLRAVLALQTGVRPPTAGLASPRHAEEGLVQCPTQPLRLPPRSYVAVSSPSWNGVAYHALLGPAPAGELHSSPRPHRPQPRRFAIIGMGAIAPSAPDSQALWTNVISKADAIGDLPPSRFDAHRTMRALLGDKEPVPRLAGVVDLPPFDPRWLKLPPAQAAALDPAVVLFIKAAEEALQQAGYSPGAWDGRRVQVVVGQLQARLKEYEVELRFVCERYLEMATKVLQAQGVEPAQLEALRAEVRRRVQATVPPLDENASQYYSGLTCAARLAAMHDFTGGMLSVDAACASSLAAVHAGLLALASREADVVVAGGVAFNLMPEYFGALSVLGVLSPQGTFPFDDRADGLVPAEGAGVVVIKRLEDAEAARDRIIAVISGIGFSSDGRGTALHAPNPHGQALAVKRALESAEVHPHQVGLVEAHGTGTRVGDVTEATAYGEVFQARGRDNPVPLGTIKSQIGHTSSASGALALIKTAFAVSEAFLPPMNGGEFPKSEIPFDRLPISLSLEGRHWPSPRDGLRRAGVSSFGLGGTNYHLILEQHDNAHLNVRIADPLPTAASYPVPSRGLTAQRWRVDLVPLSLSAERRFPLPGKRLLLMGDDPGLIAAFTRLLVTKGVRTAPLSVAGLTDALEVERRVRRAMEELGGVDGVIDLGAFGPAEYFLTLGSSRFARRVAEATARWHGTGRALYGRLRDARERTCCYVAATSMGGDFGFVGDGGNVLGGSVAGFLKALKQELPHTVIKIVDFDPHTSHWAVADAVARELEEGSDRTEIGYLAGRRFVVSMRRANFPENGPVLRRIDPSWVLLFSGGGRGAVFEVAKAVARLGPGPKVILTGRTPVPTGDEPYLALDDADFEAFRKEEMVRRKRADPALTPVKFSEYFDVFVRTRELWRNLQEVYTLGLPIEYETCDIRNLTEVRALVDRVREYHGHIDGVVHGAMLEASKSLPDKTPGGVAATTEVKVLGLVNLLESTRRDDLKLIMCFGSGAGRFGNRGQTDYSAANDLMSKCIMAYAHRARSTMRCVTVDWTAWEGTGAAVRNREVVENTGVSFISPAEGSYWFINEFLQGRTEREVAIFEERLFREWPFLGASAEGPNAITAYDDRGFLLVPSDYPLIECVARHDAEGLIASRVFDLESDPFLHQHQLYSVPIMPGTFGFEMLGEAAALFRPDLALLRAEELRIETPLKFFKAPQGGDQTRGKPVHVTITAKVVRQERNELFIRVETSSELPLGRSERTQRRVHHRGLCVLGPPPKEESGQGKLPEALPGSRARSIFHLAKEPVYLGPLFCRAEWVYVGEREVEGIIRAPRQREIFTHVARPYFQLDPLLMDAAFQVAANWDGHHNNLVSIPMGVNRLERGRQRRVGEAAHVKARVVQVEGDEVTYDIEVRGEDGGLLLGVNGLWLRRLRSR